MVLLLSIVLAMLVIMALATTVVVYVAFPHRGQQVPHAPWLGPVMQRAVDRFPALDEQRERRRD